MDKVYRDNYNKEIVKFGYLLMMEYAIFCGVSLGIAISRGMIIEYIIILLTYFFIRSYAGGVHMKSYLECLICSCILIYVIFWLIENLYISTEATMIGIVVVSAILGWMGPVECKERKIEQVQFKILERHLRKNLLFLIGIACCFYLIKAYSSIKVLGLSLTSILIACIIQKVILINR